MKRVKVAKRSPGSHEPSHVTEKLDGEASEEPLGVKAVTSESCTQRPVALLISDIELVVAHYRWDAKALGPPDG